MSTEKITEIRKLSHKYAYASIQMHETIARKAGFSATDHKYLGFFLQKGSLSDTLTQLLKQNRLCVLADDIEVRGIVADELVNGIEVIDYLELVRLTVKNPVIQSWS